MPTAFEKYARRSTFWLLKAFENTAKLWQEVRFVVLLHQDIVGAAFHYFDYIKAVFERNQQNERNLARCWQGLNAFAQLEAVYLRHVYIGQNCIELIGSKQKIQRFLKIGR